MTLKNCYDKIGSDYEAAVGRMGGSEKMLAKFAKRFPTDKTFDQLVEAYENKDFQTAFRMAHTLKGLCLNLGLDRLEKSSAALTEALRDHVADNAGELMEKVRKDYETTLAAFKEVDE